MADEVTNDSGSQRPAETPTRSEGRPAPYERNHSDRSQQGDRPQYRNNNMGGPRRRKKVCQFCVDRQENIDYKDTAKLRKFISERAKIIPRRVTGTCARHQRELTIAIKRARQVALLPFSND